VSFVSFVVDILSTVDTKGTDTLPKVRSPVEDVESVASPMDNT